MTILYAGLWNFVVFFAAFIVALVLASRFFRGAKRHDYPSLPTDDGQVGEYRRDGLI